MSVDTHSTLNPALNLRVRWVNILPIVFIMYTIAYFDRANIGIALPYITQELNLSPTQGGFVGGVLAWGYTLTQIFAGWMTLKFGSRNVVGVALLAWGLASIATGFVRTYEELVIARFMLGFCEGPVFAATAALLAEWFTKPERGRAFGFWNLSSPVGAFLAGPISGFILAHYDWRVMMVVEGLPAWIWAVLWWSRIPASLEKARWLSDGERTEVQRQLREEQSTMVEQEMSSWWSVLKEPSVWMTLVGFTLFSFLINGYTLWLPSLLKSMGDMSVVAIGILSGLPFLAGMAGIYVITRHSDLHGQERRWHSAIPTALTGAILVVAMLLPRDMMVVQIALLVLSGFTMKMFLPLIFTRLTETLPRSKAVTATVLVNTTAGFVAGFGGPYFIGYVKQATGNFETAFVALGVLGIIAGFVFAAIGGGSSTSDRAPASASYSK